MQPAVASTFTPLSPSLCLGTWDLELGIWSLGFGRRQNNSFPPSCTWRIVPAEVIWPKEVEPNEAFGLPQFTVLKTLNISTRIWNVAPPTTTFFISDRSVLTNFGPRSRLREALPKVNWSGSANAAAS